MTVRHVGVPQPIEGVTRNLGDKVGSLENKVVQHVHAPHILTGAGSPNDDETVPLGQLWVDNITGDVWTYTTTGWLAPSTVALDSITSLTLIRQSL